MRVVVGSRNAHKVREIAAIFAEEGVGFELVTIDEVAPGVELVEEEPTFEANALTKARQAAVATGLPAIADDSGIEADALDGGPGPRSARFAGEGASDAENLAKLVEVIADEPSDARAARYRCVAAIAWPDGRSLHAEGVCEGSLVATPRGAGGFGYDPIFVPERERGTMAELGDEEKDRISHRGRAFRALAELLSA